MEKNEGTRVGRLYCIAGCWWHSTFTLDIKRKRILFILPKVQSMLKKKKEIFLDWLMLMIKNLYHQIIYLNLMKCDMQSTLYMIFFSPSVNFIFRKVFGFLS